MKTSLASLLLCATATGCAASPQAPATTPSANADADAKTDPSASTKAAPAEASLTSAVMPGAGSEAFLPTTCTPDDAGLCKPDPDFARDLCLSPHPDAALAMFSKGTPWTRAYLTGDYEAWNASGGRSSKARLSFDEEVLVVSRRAAPGGIVVTGSGESFDVLRWDGSCVSLMSGEITMKHPPKAKSAAIPWRHLGEATRSALLSEPKILASEKAFGKECIAGTTAHKAKCDQADRALDKAVVDFVRAGGAVPATSIKP